MEFCLIGAGFIGTVHAANLAAHPRTRLRYVVDLSPGVVDQNIDVAVVLGQRDQLITIGEVDHFDLRSSSRLGA